MPVAQLALPAFATMACARCLPRLKCSCERSTGAALTRLVVNTAAACAGTVEYIKATSGPWPCLRRPALPAANKNPCGTVTLRSLFINCQFIGIRHGGTEASEPRQLWRVHRARHTRAPLKAGLDST